MKISDEPSNTVVKQIDRIEVSFLSVLIISVSTVNWF